MSPFPFKQIRLHERRLNVLGAKEKKKKKQHSQNHLPMRLCKALRKKTNWGLCDVEERRKWKEGRAEWD